jgi:hypothetical protein
MPVVAFQMREVKSEDDEVRTHRLSGEMEMELIEL